jgi:hypothetical protein
MGRFILTIILMVIYSGVGLVLLMVAYRLVDAFAPSMWRRKSRRTTARLPHSF